jgi:chemotaxis protein MotA
VGKGTIIGIIVGFGMLILGFVLEKGNVLSLFLLSPAIIVLGGTCGALLVSYSVGDVAKIPKLIMEAASEMKVSTQETMDTILDIATKVKKDGILTIEKMIHEEEFIKKNDLLLNKGATLLLDGLDKQLLRDILENQVYVLEQSKKREISIFEAAGGFSPTMGIIGTVMGLIQVLADMSSPEELAKSIAVAFIATLYGVCFANLLYLPLANKLKLRLKTLSLNWNMIIDGILAVNDFESPMAVKERLLPYLAFQREGKKPSAVDESETRPIRESADEKG